MSFAVSVIIPSLMAGPDYFWDACYQAFAYWTVGALTDDSFIIARITGVFKAVQSVGTAGSYGMDAQLTPLLNEHLASWSLCLFSFIPACSCCKRSVSERITYARLSDAYVVSSETTYPKVIVNKPRPGYNLVCRE